MALTLIVQDAVARAQSGVDYLAAGGWELDNFFNNAQDTAKTIGGSFLGLLGVAAVIVAGTFFVQKLISENSRRSWFSIIALLLAGGLLIVGGFTILQDIASGAQETIVDLGN
jgi:hypothetical protein